MLNESSGRKSENGNTYFLAAQERQEEVNSHRHQYGSVKSSHCHHAFLIQYLEKKKKKKLHDLQTFTCNLHLVIKNTREKKELIDFFFFEIK